MELKGVKVTQSDSAKELKITIEVDLKKFNYDDEKTGAKAPALYSSVHSAVIKKNDISALKNLKRVF